MSRSSDVFQFHDGNSKLGKGVYSWSIARPDSCPGASQVCRQICYGAQGHVARPDNPGPLWRRYIASKSRYFVPQMLAALQRKPPAVFRINDVGDFFSVLYANKWAEIARAQRHVRFFGYTRCWVRKTIWPALRELAAEPNAVLFLSIDHSMTKRVLPEGASDLPWAWLAVDDDDLPDRPVDLVFRNFRRKLRPLARLNHFGAPVCPAEDGVTKTTCRECGLCWRWKEQH